MPSVTFVLSIIMRDIYLMLGAKGSSHLSSDRMSKSYIYSRVSFYDGVTFSNIWLQIESS